MASSSEFMQYICDQLASVSGITCRTMMGEYILYIHGRIFGGIYDDRLLLKDVPAAAALMSPARREIPYPGAREMLLAEDVDNSELLCRIVEAMYPELPEPKKRRKQQTALHIAEVP